MWLMGERLERADKIESDNSALKRELKATTKDPRAIETEKIDDLAKSLRESASLGVIYKGMVKDWYEVLIVVVVFPVVIYGVLYALAMCVNWIVRGFNPS
jgi:hypothetical protein